MKPRCWKISWNRQHLSQSTTKLHYSYMWTTPSFISQSLNHATLPSSWKIHKIVPIFKAGDANSVKNYCPISLLSIVSKVLERLIFSKIITYISKFITPFQFGFTKGCSTLQQLLILTDFITKTLLQTDVIYLDISKVFDTVSHEILIEWLE